MQAQQIHTLLGLDVGTVRTGVSVANNIARIASPLTVIDMATNIPFAETIQQCIRKHDAVGVVVGLPRNLHGQDTEQTLFVREKVAEIRDLIEVPVYYMDEAVTSVRAETELKARKKPYSKADIDMLAATYILEEFIAVHPEVFETYEA